jgi:hypothetical protein
MIRTIASGNFIFDIFVHKTITSTVNYIKEQFNIYLSID